jgi:hypothetical protein
MILTTFTVAHVLISLAGIVSGLVVAWGLLNGNHLDGWTAVFLWTTVATSVTGFFFPFHGFTPAFALGIVSLPILAVAVYARYGRRLTGHWRAAYVIATMVALYLNFFVLVVQAFRRVPPLKALAPTQSEPPFAATQFSVLALFVALTIVALMRFRTTRAALAPIAAPAGCGGR